MKKRLPYSFLPFALAFFIIGSVVLSSCKKDETCRLQVNVLDSLQRKQYYKWVVIDIPENAQPSGNGAPDSPDFPIQLNTRADGFVKCEFKLPSIVQVNVYDSLDVQLLNPLNKLVVKLEPGETVTKPIQIN